MGSVSWMWDVASFAAMIAVECTDVGASTISKAAMAKGMSKNVSVVYYNALAILLLLPDFIFRRKKRAPLTFSLIWRFFLLGSIGSTGQIMSLTGIKLSSPTLSSAMANLIPIFTFLIAVIIGIETLDLRTSTSQAKSLGAIVSVAGAFIVTLYKGPAISNIRSTNSNSHDHKLLVSEQSNWILGGFLLAITCLLSATWNIVQGATVKEYPEEMTIVFFFTFFTAIQSMFLAIILERNPNAWKLKPGIELLAILYTAVFGSMFRIAIHTWCLRKKGPLYVAMFKPLGIAIAVVMTVTFLGDTLHLGSVIGSVIVAIGFYCVIWAQVKEQNANRDNEACCVGPKTSLLEANSSEIA